MSVTLRRIAVLSVLFVLVISARGAFNDAPDAPADDRKIRAGDVLRVTLNEIFGPNELSVLHLRVAENDCLTLPLVGRVSVGGLAPAAAAKRLVTAMRERGIMEAPEVTARFLQDEDRMVPAPPGPFETGNIADILVMNYGDSVRLHARIVSTVREDGTVALFGADAPVVRGLSEEGAAAAIEDVLRRNVLTHPAFTPRPDDTPFVFVLRLQ